MELDHSTFFTMIGLFLIGMTANAILATVINPIVGGILLIAITVGLAAYILEN